MHRIGIYSGTFDPIHEGHLAFAHDALATCRLDKVVLLPEQAPRFKHQVTNISDRLAKISSSISNDKMLEVLEIDEPRFHVATTLPKLQHYFPEASFTFLLGSDVVLSLRKWPDLVILLKECEFAIGMRISQTEDEVLHAISHIETEFGISMNYSLITTARSHVASSHFRAK